MASHNGEDEMNNERIDVLAVMTRALNSIEPGMSAQHDAWYFEMREARAALAELIDAANAALNQDQVELPAWLTEQLSDALAKVGAE